MESKLNPLHRHTGTPADGRKLDATNSLEKLGVAMSQFGGDTLIPGIDMNPFNSASIDTLNGRAILPDAAIGEVAFAIVVPEGAQNFLGLDLVYYKSFTGIRNLRLKTFLSLQGFNTGKTTTQFNAYFTAPTNNKGVTLTNLRLQGDFLTGDKTYQLVPGSILYIEIGRDGTDALDTFGADFGLFYVKALFS